MHALPSHLTPCTSSRGRQWIVSTPAHARSARATCQAARSAQILAAAAAPTETALTLHIDQTSISFPLKVETVEQLSAGVRELLHTFAEKQKAERPQRWKSMEFRVKGTPESQEVGFFEVFCNPNAAATAFDARVLVTLKGTGGLKITTEGRLSSLKEDLDAFLEQQR